nr:peptide chain release factor N(5)-glutamine methyltransferase [Monaibacterium marinum]
MPDIATILRAGAARLNAAGVPDPAGDARRLLSRHVTGTLAAMMRDEIAPVVAELFEADIAQREKRRPVSHILGWREFWGRRFVVTQDVLDPRPDTETLIEAALCGSIPTRILDLGTGSGAILATLLAEWPQATGVATDISDAALSVARENLASHAPNRWQAIRSDWFTDVTGTFDLIVSNPPYITAEAMKGLEPEVTEYEPHLALSPGGDGLDAYRILARDFRQFLAPHGRALFEIGYDQGDSAAGLFTPNRVEVLNDLNGKPRVLSVT